MKIQQPPGQNSSDRIEGDTIIIYDNFKEGPVTLKRVEIITPLGSKKTYKIKKTSKGGYLFN
jgi:hypothetical protein